MLGLNSEFDELAPTVEVLVGDRPLEPKAVASILAVEVSEDIDALGMFTVELDNWDLESQTVSWSDGKQFELGDAVKIKFGYGNQTELVMVGEITGLEPEFSLEKSARLVVRGHDVTHRLMRGTKTRSFTKMRDSDIVESVARSAGIRVKVSVTSEKLDYVLQRNQTDLAFIRDRALRIGYEILVEENTLVFRPFKPQGQRVLTLHRQDLFEFSPRLSTLGQINQVEVRSWDAQQKKSMVEGQARGNDLVAMGKIVGITTTAKEFGRTAYAVLDQGAISPKEAQTIAQGQLNRMALGYITGDGICQGNTTLRMGQIIRIEGLGQRFSGDYYVTATTHRFSVGEGYRTEFSVRRNAS